MSEVDSVTDIGLADVGTTWAIVDHQVIACWLLNDLWASWLIRSGLCSKEETLIDIDCN